MFISTPEGIYCYLISSGQLLDLRHLIEKKENLQNKYKFIHFDQEENTLWVDALDIYRIKNPLSKKPKVDIFKRDESDPHTIKGWVSNIIGRDSSGNIWFGTSDGYINMVSQSEKNKARPKFKNFVNEPEAFGRIKNIKFLNDSIGLFSTANGVYSLNINNNQFNKVPYNGILALNNGKSPVYDIHLRNNDIWFAIEHKGLVGVLRYHLLRRTKPKMAEILLLS